MGAAFVAEIEAEELVGILQDAVLWIVARPRPSHV
jgi:hypothetical protein